MGRDRQDIRELAYRLWENRGRPDGSSEQDWLDAERELARVEEVSEPAAGERPATPRRARESSEAKSPD